MMFFRKTYRFECPQNKDFLTQYLKDLDKNKKDLVRKNSFGSDIFYSVEFNWDEFIVSSQAEPPEQTNFTADAYIRLTSLSEELTQINVTIKYSPISWLILLFIQLLILVICLFGTEFQWWARIALLIGATLLGGAILHLSILSKVKIYKEVVEQLFKQIEEK